MKTHKIDFDALVLDFKGRKFVEIPEQKNDAGDVLTSPVYSTLGSLCMGAFLATLEEDKQRTSPGAVASAYAFALKVGSGTHDLSIDDITKIRARVAKVGWPLVLSGAVLAMLDTQSSVEPA